MFSFSSESATHKAVVAACVIAGAITLASLRNVSTKIENVELAVENLKKTADLYVAEGQKLKGMQNEMRGLLASLDARLDSQINRSVVNPQGAIATEQPSVTNTIAREHYKHSPERPPKPDPSYYWERGYTTTTNKILNYEGTSEDVGFLAETVIDSFIEDNNYGIVSGDVNSTLCSSERCLIKMDTSNAVFSHQALSQGQNFELADKYIDFVSELTDQFSIEFGKKMQVSLTKNRDDLLVHVIERPLPKYSSD